MRTCNLVDLLFRWKARYKRCFGFLAPFCLLISLPMFLVSILPPALLFILPLSSAPKQRAAKPVAPVGVYNSPDWNKHMIADMGAFADEPQTVTSEIIRAKVFEVRFFLLPLLCSVSHSLLDRLFYSSLWNSLILLDVTASQRAYLYLSSLI